MLFADPREGKVALGLEHEEGFRLAHFEPPLLGLQPPLGQLPRRAGRRDPLQVGGDTSPRAPDLSRDPHLETPAIHFSLGA